MFDHCIYFNLSTLSRKITKIWQDEFALVGLSPSHGYVLAAISENPDARQKELSEIMELDASTITRFVEVLVTKKMIVKNGSGKGATFSMTKRGSETFKKVEHLMDSLFANMQTAFGKREFKSFVGQLQKAKHVLQETQS